MKAKEIIEKVKDLKNTAVKKQMYDTALNLRNIELELSQSYSPEADINITHFCNLIEDYSFPNEYKSVLTQIARELKLNKLLNNKK